VEKRFKKTFHIQVIITTNGLSQRILRSGLMEKIFSITNE